MYIVFLVSLLPLVACFVAANPNSSHSLVSSLALRQTSPRSSATDCNANCTLTAVMQSICLTNPHCFCTVPFLQAEGDCILGQCRGNSGLPENEADAQFALDEQIARCHRAHIKINFQLDLPPAAAAIVQKFNRDSATLRRTQTAYLALQIAGGHIGLVVVLAHSVFSNRIHRDPTYINFCITWIFSSIAFSLLLYRGTTDNNMKTTLGIGLVPKMCQAQAALTEGAQVMTAASTLALIIQLWLSLRIAIYGDIYGPKRARWMTGVLLVTPYLLSLAFGLSSLFVQRLKVQRLKDLIIDVQIALPAKFYCIDNSFLQAIYGVTVTFLTLTLIFDALIINILYKNWRAFRQVKTKNAVSLSILLRFIGFSIYRVLVAIAYASVLSRMPELNETLLSDTGELLRLPSLSLIPIWVDILQATIPGVAFFVLGINRDLIHSMMFWRWFRVKH